MRTPDLQALREVIRARLVGVETELRRRGEDPGPALVVDRHQLAAIYGVQPRRISVWTDEGMPVLAGGGPGRRATYDLAAVIRWREARRGRDPSAGVVAESRARLHEAQRERIELELRHRRGDLLERAVVERAGQQAMAALKARLLAIPAAHAERLARAAAEGPAAIQAQLHAAIVDALHELQGWRPADGP